MKVAENWKKSSEIGLKTVEQLAEIIAKENAGKMAELEEKLKRLERENERLKEQLKETEEVCHNQQFYIGLFIEPQARVG